MNTIGRLSVSRESSPRERCAVCHVCAAILTFTSNALTGVVNYSCACGTDSRLAQAPPLAHETPRSLVPPAAVVARILARLGSNGATVVELARLVARRRSTVQKYLYAMREAGQVRSVPQPRGFRTPSPDRWVRA